MFTMDAAHTVRAHAQLITSELLAHYVMIVKQKHEQALRQDRRPGLGERPDRPRNSRHRARPARQAHHPGPRRPGRSRFPRCGAGVPGRAVHHPHRPQTPERLPPLQEGADPQRRGRPRRDQPVGPRGRPRALGRLRTPALVDRKQDPLLSRPGARCRVTPIRFPRPLAEPGVRVSTHRALHGCRQAGCSVRHGDGIAAPR